MYIYVQEQNEDRSAGPQKKLAAPESTDHSNILF